MNFCPLRTFLIGVGLGWSSRRLLRMLTLQDIRRQVGVAEA